jgi:predicted phage terminase large subunit-like protein
MTFYSKRGLTDKQLEIRALAMADLRAFVGLVAPERMLGHCHLDLLKFLMEDDQYQLVIWPRGHQKSTMLAYWCAWKIINDPSITILYTSATSDLTEKQINFIKGILDSDVVRKYWSELLNPEQGKRECWRAMEFAVDHPARQAEAIRFPTCKGVGVGGNITGFHADILVLDDLVVMENVETKTTREDVRRSYSLFNSILNPNGTIKAIGTRYHPEDLYNDLITMTEDHYDDTGVIVESRPVYKTMTAVVEQDDSFLWPRQKRKDGKWFGFDRAILGKIKTNYLDKAQFFAQYYNDPSDPMNKKINNFVYYDKTKLHREMGKWKIGSVPLNVYAAIDIAATMTDRSDYTAIAVIGIDSQHNIFVLDIDRFKTDKISVMTEHLNRLYTRWGWIRLRAEVNAAQNLAIEQIKDNNKQLGIFYSIDKCNQQTNKELRIMTNLEPRYAQGMIYHYRGGFIEGLEQELTSTKPPHDDMADALAAAVEIAVPPSKRGTAEVIDLQFNSRFGGVS